VCSFPIGVTLYSYANTNPNATLRSLQRIWTSLARSRTPHHAALRSLQHIWVALARPRTPHCRYDVRVGKSDTRTKTVELPRADLEVLPVPINEQDPKWNDRFEVDVDGAFERRRLNARLWACGDWWHLRLRL
jgi:hypothetical protein